MENSPVRSAYIERKVRCLQAQGSVLAGVVYYVVPVRNKYHGYIPIKDSAGVILGSFLPENFEAIEWRDHVDCVRGTKPVCKPGKGVSEAPCVVEGPSLLEKYKNHRASECLHESMLFDLVDGLCHNNPFCHLWASMDENQKDDFLEDTLVTIQKILGK